VSNHLAAALLEALDDDVLDELARRLAPRLERLAEPTTDGLTVEQAAASVGVSARSIRRALTAGALVGRRVTGRWQIGRGDLAAWQAEGGSTSSTPSSTPGRAGSRALRATRGEAALLALKEPR